jgi:hypothetical protein
VSHFKIELENPRELSDDEWKILNKMMSVDFIGKEIIIKQLNASRVVNYCPCGCKTVDIKVDINLPQYKFDKRVPVELRTFSKSGVPIIASIHVINGYVEELEIYRADSEEIDEEIILDDAIIEVH